jgi:hypothetical protein
VDAEEQGSWAFVHCVGALLSLISFVACVTCMGTTKGHPGFLPCKRGRCIHGNLSKVPFDGCLLVTVVTMLKSSSGDTQHFVEFLVFYGHRFICIMLCFCYSSVRCLHGECRYTTDLTQVEVTLDYVVVSNRSLTQIIALFLYFLKLTMVHWCALLAL